MNYCALDLYMTCLDCGVTMLTRSFTVSYCDLCLTARSEFESGLASRRAYSSELEAMALRRMGGSITREAHGRYEE